MKNIFISSIVIFLLVSCASGSHILTGQKRDPILPSQVKLYDSPPQQYEVIGIVKASSDAGWTQQGDMDYAIEEKEGSGLAITHIRQGLALRQSTTSSITTSAGNFVKTLIQYPCFCEGYE